MRLNDTEKEVLIQLQREGCKYHEELVEKWILDGKIGKRPSIAEAIADHMIANDVVPVVRCKYCMHTDKWDNGCLVCLYGGRTAIVKPDHFCSHGERRVKNEDSEK